MNNPEDMRNLRVLPPLVVDFGETGQKQQERFGQSETPVTVLPEVVIDFDRPYLPVLQVTLQLGPDIAPASAALEVMRLVHALDWYERGLGGHGLIWDNHSDAAPEQGVVRIVLTAGSAAGAVQRFQRLKDAINDTLDPNILAPKLLAPTAGVFVKREAVLLTTVA